MFAQAAIRPGPDVDWEEFLTGFRGAPGIMLMVAEETPFEFGRVAPLLRELDAEVFGGIFPGVIFGDRWYRSGAVACAFTHPVRLLRLSSLGEPQLEQGQNATLLVLLDGMAAGISDFLHGLFASCGPGTTFLGGGAGRLTLRREPCLFTRNGIFAGGAILAATDQTVAVGVEHGWQAFQGPYVATRAEGTRLKELNWRPAFDVYRQAVERYSGETLHEGNFFDIAKRFPLGMARLDGSVVVRDPIRTEPDGSLVLVGEVPQNSVLMLMRGDPDHLVRAAGEAARQAALAHARHAAAPPRAALVVDCISRVLYLEEAMERELRAIRDALPPGTPIFGFLSLGEVASRGDRYVEFYNKTTVVGVA
ncbi:MAG: FIST C-terminal domain-containing protein [Firmicutes bacterium]|nr:FIST C-terminal domain-containing protein [Bacillota bacterium]